MPNDSRNIILMARRIQKILREVKNNSFEYYKNDSLTGQISVALAQRIVELGITSFNEAIFRRAWECLDFLLFAELIESLGSREQWLTALLDSNGALLYDHQMHRFNHLRADATVEEYAQALHLSEIFTQSDHERIIYWNPVQNGQCLRLLHDARWRLSDLIEAQPDLLGVNSLVREGLVRSLYLPDGLRIITKRNNPSKQGRFLNEQYNVDEIVARLGLPERSSSVQVGESDLRLKVIRPFAVACDRPREAFYSLAYYEDHPTLESILLREKLDVQRRRYLAYARRVLDHLYSEGIVWGDMAPRNILVEEGETGVTFYLLDFEKTYFTEGSVPLVQRAEHARGPMCVEEFGAVCFPDEVAYCFDGYFAPEAWSLSDASPIPFAKPKREVIDILLANGISQPTLGQYNAAERLIIDIRFPFIGEDGLIREVAWFVKTGISVS